MLHRWEEPCLGEAAGAVFFSGCSLGCVYCQNRSISRRTADGGTLPGEVYDTSSLAALFMQLRDMGASCLDLVTPTHYAPTILAALSRVKAKLGIPVVWNTGGYETIEAIRATAGLVDIYLTDFKYGGCDPAGRYSDAPDYADVASAALAEMYRVAGDPHWDGERLTRGIILRHLVLPGGRKDSIMALSRAAEAVAPSSVVLSLMRQYTPDFAPEEYRQLRRRVTTFEYESVLAEAIRLGYDGYTQQKESASARYTPV